MFHYHICWLGLLLDVSTLSQGGLVVRAPARCGLTLYSSSVSLGWGKRIGCWHCF